MIVHTYEFRSENREMWTVYGIISGNSNNTGSVVVCCSSNASFYASMANRVSSWDLKLVWHSRSLKVPIKNTPTMNPAMAGCNPPLPRSQRIAWHGMLDRLSYLKSLLWWYCYSSRITAGIVGVVVKFWKTEANSWDPTASCIAKDWNSRHIHWRFLQKQSSRHWQRWRQRRRTWLL